MIIDSYASKIEIPINNIVFSKAILDMHDCFNRSNFVDHMNIPDYFGDFVNIIYDSFKIKRPSLSRVILDVPKNVSLDYNKVLLGFSGGLDSVAQLILLKNQGYEVIPYSMFNVNFYENGQGNKACIDICDKLNLKLVKANFKRCLYKNNAYYKQWQENPIKNQMILASMADYCLENGIGNMSLGDDFELDISDAMHGTNTTDAKQVTESFLYGLNKHIPDLKFLPMQKGFNKLDRIKLLIENKLQNYYYSCLQGRFTHMRHKNNSKKYKVSVFAKNCVCTCRKCSHHNLLLHYGNVKTFPNDMIEKCWKTLGAKTSADNVLFDESIPLETRINNLFAY